MCKVDIHVNFAPAGRALPEILQDISLEVEGMSDSLHHSRLFDTWISPYESDKVFGALVDVFRQSLSGKNV